MKKAQLINLGLQGGGAHGAFGWGVLDYLLEDGRLTIEGISATSAGAMNAIAIAQGMLNNDRDDARQALYDFWLAVSKCQLLTSFKHKFEIPGMSKDQHTLETSPAYVWFNMMTHLLSPYQYNPLNINPLRDILEHQIDFERIKENPPFKLFLCATNVETCKIKIFSGSDVSVNAVLASACLPSQFQAVEIDGEYFWDGGFMGNPAIFPLIYHCDSRDVIVVHINPIVRQGPPQTISEIINRINEVSFNSSLMREMRAIAFISSLQDDKQSGDLHLKRMLMHSIRADEEMSSYDISSKMNADWNFLTHLRDKGRHTAQKWLEKNYKKIGKKSSFDINKEFL
ncbi:MAG: alpha/beta hydrolase [Legionella sp.]|nr:MAG: alpha/beta hydrolase [Legionella sp.]PJD99101.1 MAG: alpha/beta hydrolase [Legionella sp.]